MEVPKISTIEDVIRLPSVQLTRRNSHALPDTPAVYFVYSARYGLLYIGACRSPRRRWQTHHHSVLLKVAGMRIGWLLLPITDLPHVEREMIRRFDPPMNTAVKCGDARWQRFGYRYFGLPYERKYPRNPQQPELGYRHWRR